MIEIVEASVRSRPSALDFEMAYECGSRQTLSDSLSIIAGENARIGQLKGR
jgi:hypothetical protein